MPAATSGRVFISYRRRESSGLAGRLYDRLAGQFGEDQVFMDVDTIAPGVDFAEVITQAVSTCEVLLAVIGPHWLDASDQDGRRRLEDPDDIVRLEIAAALERDIRVIPILVEGAPMPGRQELPDALAGLARRHALSLRHESFRAMWTGYWLRLSPFCILQRLVSQSLQAPWGRSHRHQGRPKPNRPRPLRLVRLRPRLRPTTAQTLAGRAHSPTQFSTRQSGERPARRQFRCCLQP